MLIKSWGETQPPLSADAPSVNYRIQTKENLAIQQQGLWTLKLWGRHFRQEHVFWRITGSTSVARTLSGCQGRKTSTHSHNHWTMSLNVPGGQGSRGLPTWNIGIVSESIIHRHCIRLISFIPAGQWGLATSGDRQWFVKKFFCKVLVRNKETTHMKMCLLSSVPARWEVLSILPNIVFSHSLLLRLT